MKIILFSILAFYCISAGAQDNYLLAGTYTNGKSEGIYVFRFNSSTAGAEQVSVTKSTNPSFISVSPTQKNVYAVNEIGNGKGGKVSSFGFNKTTGSLQFINQQPTGGDDPCFVQVDKTGKWLVVANYSGGSFTVFPLNNDGGIDSAATHIQHVGSSVNKARQEKAHVHSTFFSADNHYLFVQDLGMDQITVYPFNDKTGKILSAKKKVTKTTPGAGPRHITFSADNKFVYCINELSGTVAVYQFKRGSLRLLEEKTAASPGFTGFMGSADIHISADGNFLYCSNRGDANDIAIFKINKKSGRLSLAGFQSTQGIGPRNFTIEPTGKYLLVANQNSDDIVIFSINKNTGMLTDTGKRIAIGSPVCLKWAEE
ncbi:MAG: lactonase family protein [Bacteroidetes bacterium]|nr:lactonase family protein [Bacteroidota bacterium]